jgi:hypothetical protein
MTPIKETDLAEKVVNWLKEQGWEVYQEVTYGSVADIVATKNNIIWIIECKTAFGIQVINQALAWVGCAHYISIAVPHIAHYNKQLILKYLPIGLITVRSTPTWEGKSVDEIVKSPGQKNILLIETFRKHLCEEQKTWAKAGNNCGDRFTPFKNTVKHIEIYLKDHPGATMKEILKNVKHHYANDASAKGSIPELINRDIIKTIRMDETTRPAKFYLRETK